MPKLVSIESKSQVQATYEPAQESPAEAVAEHQSREYNRTPWSGNLDEIEIARPGGLLLAALVRCANDRRLQLNDMARELGVTYGYINQLRNGLRNVNQVSDEFTLACARFLGVARLTVLMLAGRVTPEDVFEAQDLMATEVPRAMSYICDDPAWGPLITPELRRGSIESQYALVRLYESATGKLLMDSRIDLDTLAANIQQLQAVQENRTVSMLAHAESKRRDA